MDIGRSMWSHRHFSVICNDMKLIGNITFVCENHDNDYTFSLYGNTIVCEKPSNRSTLLAGACVESWE
jgi:hypothetical protein